MNVYCSVCGSEMEIMNDLVSELQVYPCGCGGNGKQKRQPTKRALDVCPSCAGKGTYQIGVYSETCSACHGTGTRQ